MARLERLGAPCRRDSRCEIRRWDQRERRLIMTLSTTFDNIPNHTGVVDSTGNGDSASRTWYVQLNNPARSIQYKPVCLTLYKITSYDVAMVVDSGDIRPFGPRHVDGLVRVLGMCWQKAHTGRRRDRERVGTWRLPSGAKKGLSATHRAGIVAVSSKNNSASPPR